MDSKYTIMGVDRVVQRLRAYKLTCKQETFRRANSQRQRARYEL